MMTSMSALRLHPIGVGEIRAFVPAYDGGMTHERELL